MSTSHKFIELPLSLYLLVNDQHNPIPDVSTHRSEAGGLRSFIFQRMVDTWSQAAIQLEVESIQYLEVPVDVLQGFGRAASVQEIEPYMDAVENLPRSGAAPVAAFYVRKMPPDLNGIARPNSNTFFVIDDPTLVDPTGFVHNGRALGARVGSHELGHVLGLRHYKEPECYDRTRLMFRGTQEPT